MHCCTVTAGGARRVPCWHRYSQLKPSDPWDRWAHFWGYFCRYWDGQREHGNNQPARPTQQNLRGRPPLRILLALESTTQACRRGVKHRCWEQQSAWRRRRGCSEPMQLLSKSDLSKDRGHAAMALRGRSAHLLITVSAFSCPSLIVLAFAWTVGSIQIKGKPLPFSSYVGGVTPGTTCPDSLVLH